MGNPGRLPVDDAELQPEAAGAGDDRIARMWDAQFGAPEHVDQVERTGRRDRRGDRPEGRNPKDGPFVRVDRDAVVALSDEVAEDPEGRPGLVRRRAHDCDATARPKQLGDPIVVEQRDRATGLGEVEERDRPGAIGGPGGAGGAVVCPIGRRARGPALVPGRFAQVRVSRSYGWPTAAGAMLRPTTPARMMIVMRYGSAL